jgi:hypothetical protein
MNIINIAAEALSGGQSQKVALSTTSAQTAAVSTPTGLPVGVPIKCLLTLDAAGFIRKGADPTAVSDGTDQYVPANTPFRVELMAGEKVAAILGTGTGNMYFTPGA